MNPQLTIAPEFLAELSAGSWEADRLIALAIGWTSRIHKPQTNYDMEWEEWIPPGPNLVRGSTRLPLYTRDLNAAFSLEPEGVTWCLGKWVSHVADEPPVFWMDVHIMDGSIEHPASHSLAVRHACRELAVCIGFLEARRALAAC